MTLRGLSQRALKVACMDDLTTFTAAAFPIFHGGAPLELDWAIRAICTRAQAMAEGRELRLIINMPPRCLKSMIMSVFLPAWILGNNPAAKVMVVSYSSTLAIKHSLDCRRLMESEFYRSVFPGTRLAKVTQEILQTDRGGDRYAATIGGTVTGLGAGYIIIDDPMSATDTYSEAARQAVLRFFDGTLSSRLDNPSTGGIALAMQRLHVDDLAGHLIARGGWRQLKLQARAAYDQTVEIADGVFHEVRTGDLLAPNRLTDAFLDDQIQQMGSRAFQAQYQQDPAPAAGNMVKRQWLRYAAQAPARGDNRVIISLDTATKTDPVHDYSAATVWMQVGNDHHLIDVGRGKYDYPSLKAWITNFYAAHNADVLLIEDHGNGAALIQELRHSSINAIGIKATMPKEVRLAAASAFIEAGKMWLPPEAHWLGEFEAELLSFPNGRYDDQVDSLSQYFGWVRDKPPGYLIFDTGSGGPGSGGAGGGQDFSHDYIAEAILGIRW